MPTAPTLEKPVRLGCVSYLNTLPLIEGLGKLADARLTLTAPSRLIDLLVDDQVDLALVSLIDYQRSPVELAMLPVGMIGCDGPTMTVRLFSAKPIDQIQRIHVDVDSHTSATLVRVLGRAATGRVPEIEWFDVDAARAERDQATDAGRAADWPEALVLIGDKVVTDSPPAIRYPHQLDLGEAWKRDTGLPFVYATWMCRADRADDPTILASAATLDRQRRHNATRLDAIAAARAPVRGWPLADARTYLKRMLRFEVSPPARRAVDRFFDEALAAGLIQERRPTRWIE